MDGETQQSVVFKLEQALDEAARAEAAGNFEEAEHLFSQALHYEALLSTENGDADAYVAGVGPLYPEKAAQLPVPEAAHNAAKDELNECPAAQ